MTSVRIVTVLLIVGTAAALSSAVPLDTAEQKTTELTLEENIAEYIQKQEIAFDVLGSQVTLGARNLDLDELDLKVQLSSEGEARKSKLKKIFAPILVVVILKAITLIPLALGILSLKTWNALQLSFVTFVVTIALGVFELCKKVAWDHAHPIVTHTGWNPGRSFEDENAAQNLAYSAYRD